MTSTSAPLPAAHQTHAELAPQLTQFQTATGVSDIVLFDGHGICMAFGGGDQVPVDAQRQARAERAAAIYSQLLSLAEGVPALWPGRAVNGVETITLRHALHGEPWPVVVCRLGEGGIIAALPPGTATPVLGREPVSGLGYQLVRLAERLLPQVEGA